MKKTIVSLLAILSSFIGMASVFAQSQTESLEARVLNAKYTGDLDELIQRRVIRVLTVYSKTFYFIDQGTPRGIVYDGVQAFSDELNAKLKTGNLKIHFVFIPVSRNELIPFLAEGKGDIAMANLTITPERQKLVDFTDPVFKDVNEIVITGPKSPPIATLDDLSGKEVYVRKSSSYYESLMKLNEDFKKKGKPPVILKPAPENLEDEDFLEMLNAGLVKVLVVDQHIAVFWKQIFPNITLHPDVILRGGGNIGWAVRKNSPKFLAELNGFIKTHGKGTVTGNLLLQKYLKNTKYVVNSTSAAELKKFELIKELFLKYGTQYSVDAVLMAAQGYQESRLNQNVKSPVGAIGVMQVMPATGKDMKVGDIAKVDPNIHAGIKYMRFMMDQYYKNEPMDNFNKMIFSFASYNAGPARIAGLRKKAAARGLNPNIWFGNVERIASEEIGRETVTYVSNIYKYYLAYKLILEEEEKKQKIKQQIEKQ
jgi:membrane-bound lytic murein transglycosylase MltF